MEGFDAWLQPEVIWFLIGLVLLVLEFAAPGLIIAFFGVGAWLVALICLIIDISFTTQLVIFLITSIFLLVFLRKSLKRIFKLEAFDNQNELEDFIGKRAVVTEKISANKPGKVVFNGTAWEAESETAIAKGAAVIIRDRYDSNNRNSYWINHFCFNSFCQNNNYCTTKVCLYFRTAW